MMHKRNILYFLLLLCNFQNIPFCQSTLTIGVKGGLIQNQYIVSDALEKNSGFKSGFALGITAELLKSKHFMLISDLLYLKRGMSFKSGDYFDAHNSGETSVSCLSLSVLPAFRLKTIFLSPYLFAGPRIEFVLNHNDANYPDFYYNLNNFNFGFSSGVGFEKEISGGVYIHADFRYSRDFTYFKRIVTVGYGLANFTNSSFDFLLGVNFNIRNSRK
jgi:opacity protein-like surface antigen